MMDHNHRSNCLDQNNTGQNGSAIMQHYNNMSNNDKCMINNNLNKHSMLMSNKMRKYIDSLPKQLSIKEELLEYRFWKSLRTEFIATFLFVIFTCGILFATTSSSSSFKSSSKINHTLLTMNDDDQIRKNDQSQSYYVHQSINSNNKIELLINSVAVGLIVSVLIQCTGHVCGCHLSIAITISLYLTERISMLRLISYLLIQFLASILGILVVENLFNMTVQPLLLPITTIHNYYDDHQQQQKQLMINNNDSNLNKFTPTQIFGFEFLSTFLIVLTYLSNCDRNRSKRFNNLNNNNFDYNAINDSSKSMTIGFAYSIGHLFSYMATGALMNPAKALAISIITEQYCLHWIYWIAPVLGGFFGGLIYDYIGSIKPISSPEKSSLFSSDDRQLPPSSLTPSSTLSSMHLALPILSSSSTSTSCSSGQTAQNDRIKIPNSLIHNNQNNNDNYMISMIENSEQTQRQQQPFGCPSAINNN